MLQLQVITNFLIIPLNDENVEWKIHMFEEALCVHSNIRPKGKVIIKQLTPCVTNV